jgi:hypothetical protein
MIDKRIHYYLVLDVETANGLDDPLVYDIGGAIADKQGRIYETFSFVIRDIFVYERFLMETAYYANKVPDYIQDLENDKQSVTLEPEKHENNSNARQQNKTKCC